MAQPFGYILPNAVIKPALLRHAEARPGVTLRFETGVTALRADDAGVTATLSTGEERRAALVLAADGRFSKTREMAGIKARVIEYGQTAIVCAIRHARPHHGLALERFLPAGPFAVLPMQGDRSGVVWTETHAMAQHMLGLEDAAFVEELRLRAGEHLGGITLEGPRFSYPLCLVLARDCVARRLALIGDAAHAIHPIAGQGVNLGYRDVATLAEILAEAHRLGLDLGSASLLEEYRRRRRWDTFAMTAATDGINRLFSNRFPPLRLARRLGLAAVERLPPIKRYFMLHAMGLTGDLPEMLREKAA